MINITKIACLDLGDRWVGVALSDPSHTFAHPHETIELSNIITYLHTLIEKEHVTTIVVGIPITLQGNESDQTRKIKSQVTALKEEFSHITWILQDERMTSKYAQQLPPKKKGGLHDKQIIHSRAASFLLSMYLESLHRDNEF